MAGLTYNYCKDIPVAITYPTFGTFAGWLCTSLKDNQVLYGSKDCNGYTTPPLSWIKYSLKTEDLPEEFSVALDVWLGIEEKPDGRECLWMGVDGGPELQFCFRSPGCYDEAIEYGVLTTLAEDLLNQLADAVPDGSAIDLILKVAFWLVVLVVVVAAAFILSGPALTALAVTGLLGGGAIVS